MTPNNIQIIKLDESFHEGFATFVYGRIKETQFKAFGLTMDLQVVSETIHDHVTQDDKCLFLAVDIRTQLPVGCLFGSAQRHPFSRDMCANELYFSVIPEYRKQGISKLLITHFEEWATLRNCKFMVIGIGEVSSKEGVSSNGALQHMGFRLFYTGYHKMIG